VQPAVAPQYVTSRVPVTVRLATQAPPLQVAPAPQDVPSAATVPVSVQAGNPLEQSVVPTWQAFVGVQDAPCVQALQVPFPQTSATAGFTSHAVPFAFAAPSTHCDVPVEQEVTPSRQTLGLPVHGAFAVQATHAPALQTWSVPQEVPFATEDVVSRQTAVPVEHDVVPATHRFGFVVQAAPAVHEPHTPALHTWFVPQEVPFARGVSGLRSTHTDAPVAHEVTPS
jgi:hypothetical protein